MNPTLKEITQRIQQLMYGRNYEVYLDIEIFDGTTTADFKRVVNEKYPEADTESYPLVQLDKTSYYDDIWDKLNYRGHEAAGLTLTPGDDTILRKLQQKYFDYADQFIDEQTTFFRFADTGGIPGEVAFWEYRYVLFCSNNKILFVYGSGSD